jgi:imidazolonepropionase-like amidohydrolase
MSKVLAVITSLFAAGAAVAETTAFVNVNVVPMVTDQVLENRTVIVVEGSIAAIGRVAETPVPRDAQVVDGTDRYLMPGLAEMHGRDKCRRR